MIKRIINKLIYLSLRDRINILKTLVVNFMLLPFKQALHFPILIYGPCKLGMLRGKVILSSPINKGMLQIGASDSIRSYHNKSFVEINGMLEIHDRIVLRRGINLHVATTGHIVLENDVFIGDNNTIISFEYVKIGKATRIGNNNTFMDSDFHYTINTQTREVKRNKKPIVIGENCWIGGWCTIKKGTQLPDGTIVAGPYSMVGKNYVNKIPEYSLIAGSPAKLLVENMRRVNNLNSEAYIDKYWAKGNEEFILPEDIEIDSFCLPTIKKRK